jgi:hypothetical protein
MATGPQDSAVPGIGLPPRVVEDLLSVPRRRTMLRCLADAEGEMLVDDLVACVRDRDGGTDDQPREQVRADLYDEHLPKLTATGVVTYDSMRESVELATPAITDTEW